MTPSKKRMKRFMALLSAAHKDGSHAPSRPAGPDWQASVMRSVRQAGRPSDSMRPAGDIFQLAWRLSPAAVVLVIIFSAFIIQTGYRIYAHIATLSVAEPAQTYLVHIPF
ncbi:MAG: hypothetical protein ACOCTS_03060 [Thermodesulfobacteriota bacterium]